MAVYPVQSNIGGHFRPFQPLGRGCGELKMNTRTKSLTTVCLLLSNFLILLLSVAQMKVLSLCLTLPAFLVLARSSLAQGRVQASTHARRAFIEVEPGAALGLGEHGPTTEGEPYDPLPPTGGEGTTGGFDDSGDYSGGLDGDSSQETEGGFDSDGSQETTGGFEGDGSEPEDTDEEWKEVLEKATDALKDLIENILDSLNGSTTQGQSSNLSVRRNCTVPLQQYMPEYMSFIGSCTDANYSCPAAQYPGNATFNETITLENTWGQCQNLSAARHRRSLPGNDVMRRDSGACQSYADDACNNIRDYVIKSCAVDGTKLPSCAKASTTSSSSGSSSSDTGSTDGMTSGGSRTLNSISGDATSLCWTVLSLTVAMFQLW